MAVTKAQRYVIEVFVNSFIYGGYCTLIGVVLYALTSKRKVYPSHKAMFLISILMFLFTTVHLCILLVQAYHNRMIPTLNQAATSLAIVQMFLGDSILIWRVWIVWGQSVLYIILPCLLVLSSTVLGFCSMAAITNPGIDINFAPSALVSVVNTLLCTTLIGGRLWYVRCRAAKSLGPDGFTTSLQKYTRIIILLIESGAIYSAAVTTTLILSKVGNPVGLDIVINMTFPLVGILPTLIIIFVHFDIAPSFPGKRMSRMCKRTVEGVMVIGKDDEARTRTTRMEVVTLGQESIGEVPVADLRQSIDWQVRSGTHVSEISIEDV